MARDRLTELPGAQVEIEVTHTGATARFYIEGCEGHHGSVTVAALEGRWASATEAFIAALEGAIFSLQEAAEKGGFPVRRPKLVDLRGNVEKGRDA